MTAEVSIMNVHGVAMAADSAVTLDHGKVYNTTDKLFALSKYYPVGIMIYSKSDIMGIGWDTIIKHYRNELRDKSFDTLSGYAEDFLNFLSKFSYFDENQMKDYFESVCYNVFDRILHWFLDDLRKLYDDKGEITKRQIDDVFTKSLKDIKDKMKNVSDEKQLKIDEDFIDTQMESFNEMLKMIFEDYPIPKKLVQEILSILKLNFQKCGWMDDYTGIVICGYGERELFPTNHTFKVSGKLGKGLIYFEENITRISPNDLTSSIGTYAQSEVVHTFIKGIDPDFGERIEDKISYMLSSIAEYLPAKYKSKIPEIIELFKEYMQDTIDVHYKRPVLDIVDSLEKNDLTSMAEAMINLTALKRHVTTDSETVGGPIDVAYISKGDGFIWIKKKTNYDPAINIELKQNYFNGRQI